jgi:hypothetical protein
MIAWDLSKEGGGIICQTTDARQFGRTYLHDEIASFFVINLASFVETCVQYRCPIQVFYHPQGGTDA